MNALVADLQHGIDIRDARIFKLELELSNRNRLLEKIGAWIDDTGSRFVDTARILKR